MILFISYIDSIQWVYHGLSYMYIMCMNMYNESIIIRYNYGI